MTSDGGYDVTEKDSPCFVSYGHGYDIGTTNLRVDWTTKWLLKNFTDGLDRIGVGENPTEGLILAFIYLYADEIGDEIDSEFKEDIQGWYDEQAPKRRRLFKEEVSDD